MEADRRLWRVAGFSFRHLPFLALSFLILFRDLLPHYNLNFARRETPFSAPSYHMGHRQTSFMSRLLLLFSSFSPSTIVSRPFPHNT
jgi:hypothetical protein